MRSMPTMRREQLCCLHAERGVARLAAQVVAASARLVAACADWFAVERAAPLEAVMSLLLKSLAVSEVSRLTPHPHALKMPGIAGGRHPPNHGMHLNELSLPAVVRLPVATASGPVQSSKSRSWLGCKG